MMINTNNIETAKKMIKNSKIKPVIVVAQNDGFNRKMLEYGNFGIILGIEGGMRKDSIRQLDSGFNHVLGEITAKKHISIGIDIGGLRNMNKFEKIERIARIKQNIQICRKSGVKLTLLNIKDKKDAFALLISLGASTKQAKESIYF